MANLKNKAERIMLNSSVRGFRLEWKLLKPGAVGAFRYLASNLGKKIHLVYGKGKLQLSS